MSVPVGEEECFWKQRHLGEARGVGTWKCVVVNRW